MKTFKITITKNIQNKIQTQYINKIKYDSNNNEKQLKKCKLIAKVIVYPIFSTSIFKQVRHY